MASGTASELDQSLAGLLRNAVGASKVRITARSPNAYTSTAKTEIVTCRADGRTIDLLCKWGETVSHGHPHRHGLAHEARVYREVLTPLGTTTPRFYGTLRGDDSGICLVIEYLRTAVRVSKPPAEHGIIPAAGWLGRFHRSSVEHGMMLPLWMPRYDLAYYDHWARRSLDFARTLNLDSVRLEALVEGSREVFGVLESAGPVVVHGECYPHNVLVSPHGVHPVDWETCAIGSGEIDLVALTEGWPAETTREAEFQYARARWPDGAPHLFQETLTAARLHLALRWLGDRIEWSTGERSRARWVRVNDLLTELMGS
jgi:hypothetical protein